ncbi:TfoX/Sxy family protein [Luteimicrobium subarcticum]|uniref:TfoX/Sxy family transcriptional regulator of competence genes n=1 Tax=Luteimicrobium subarcticum TaxID=620910 RepID=A0A2M8WRQ0_9MICO|nr:TfoX/Sxy family protein [Luteimicrobium subarcticum]PJI93588.1 TfoX/Sxy family transcriptional regulator of competence genes [Luteimicrobium subarcticum]
MAYDPVLAERVRERVGSDVAITEKRMFGSLAFLWDGHIVVGVQMEGLLLRVAHEDLDAVLREPGVAVADMGGKTMKGWVTVDGAYLDDDALDRWLQVGLDYATGA